MNLKQYSYVCILPWPRHKGDSRELMDPYLIYGFVSSSRNIKDDAEFSQKVKQKR